tara:strand:- start:2005 stop:2286 length:282 start_codon:yes stop_codon:yes gene_type:complete
MSEDNLELQVNTLVAGQAGAAGQEKEVEAKKYMLNMRNQLKKKFIDKIEEEVLKQPELEELTDHNIVISFNKEELKKMIAEKIVERVIEKIKL